MSAPDRIRTITIAQYIENGWPQDVPFVFKHRSFDIPNTVARAIMALPDNCVAIGLGVQGGYEMMRRAERAARHRGIRILWRRLQQP